MANRTLLCVEPDDGALQTIRGALERYGFDVKNIASGEQAIDWGRKNTPALIMVSVEPRKVGYAICNKIKRSPELKDVPLILTSGEETLQTFEQHKKLKSRADEYMLKPLDRDELLAKIDQLLGLGDVSPQLSPMNSEELMLTSDISDEVSIDEADIFEDEKSDPNGAFAASTIVAPAAGERGELESIFDQETDAAFAALQGSDKTGPISGTGGGSDVPSPWSPDGWSDESTRVASFPPSDGAPLPAAALIPPAERTLAPEPRTNPDVEAAGDGAYGAPQTAGENGHSGAFSFPLDVPPSPDDVHPALDQLSDGPAPELQARVRELETRLRHAEEDKQRMQAEVEEVRGRLVAQPFSKEKEYLSLREVINRKEKDLLDLRDAFDAKERQILDQKDRIREHERARRDFEEKTLGIEKNLMIANERVAALAQDKEKSVEREKGTKARLDDALTEISKAHDEVDTLKKRLASAEERGRGEVDRVRDELESRVAELEDTHRKEIAKLTSDQAEVESALKREHANDLARMESQQTAELESTRKTAAEELAAATARLENELSKARREHEKALASAKEEQSLQLAAERQAHGAAIEAKERDHRNELLGMRRRHEEELGAAEEKRQREATEAEARRIAELEAAEGRRRAELQQRDESHHAVMADMDRRHFTEKTETAERHRNDLDQAHARAARAEGELAARTEELAEAHRRLTAHQSDMDGIRADLRDRDVKLAQSRDRVSELEGKVADFEDQILRAFQKMRADEKAIDKAKRALAVALTLLEERGAAAIAAAPTPGRTSEESGS